MRIFERARDGVCGDFSDTAQDTAVGRDRKRVLTGCRAMYVRRSDQSTLRMYVGCCERQSDVVVTPNKNGRLIVVIIVRFPLIPSRRRIIGLRWFTVGALCVPAARGEREFRQVYARRVALLYLCAEVLYRRLCVRAVRGETRGPHAETRLRSRWRAFGGRVIVILETLYFRYEIFVFNWNPKRFFTNV